MIVLCFKFYLEMKKVIDHEPSRGAPTPRITQPFWELTVTWNGNRHLPKHVSEKKR